MTNLHVNNFERDLGGRNNGEDNIKYQLHDDFSNEDLTKIMQDWKTNQYPRLESLQNYYNAHNTGILNRAKRTTGWADYKKSAPFPRQISDFITSFSVANPVTVSLPNSEQSEHNGVDEFNRINDIDSHNYDVWLDTSIFGRAYELMYRGEDNATHIVRISPLEGVGIYNLDVEPKLLAFVRVISNPIVDNGLVDIVVYRSNSIEKYNNVTLGIKIPNTPDEVENNPFGEVPVVEYVNNPQRIGDFEPVLDMIDLYDFANNDTANFLTDLPNATLVVSGALETAFGASLDYDNDTDDDFEKVTDKKAREFKKSISDSAVIALKNGVDAQGNNVETKAQYLHPDTDVSGNEAHKTRLENEIFRGAYVPNLAQMVVGGNVTSGVAMQYKLIGTIQVAKRKRRLFERGLYKRYFIAKSIEHGAGWNFDVDMLKFTFTDNLPQDEVSILSELHAMGLIVPQSHMAELIPSVTDVNEYLEQVKSEKEEQTEEYMNQAQRDSIYNNVEED